MSAVVRYHLGEIKDLRMHARYACKDTFTAFVAPDGTRTLLPDEDIAPHPAPPPSNGYVSGVTTTSQASRAPPQADLEGPWRALRGLEEALGGLGGP